MANIAVMGISAGDEGKGSVVHHLSTNYDYVIRYSGGSNAGHTIYRDNIKYVYHLLPCVDWRNKNTKAYLGSGMVIDLEELYLEVSKLEENYPDAPTRVYVDKEAFLVLEHHKVDDKLNNSHIGSTNRGIGPAYKDKVARKGARIDDLFTGRFSNLKLSSFISKLSHLGVHFVHQLEMRSEMEKSNLLFEGAQGALLDLNYGIYPYVSCGDASLSGIYSSGFGFAKLDHIYGVAKCYTTKVGEGPFPTELLGVQAEQLRKLGNEYGSTTGRPRRVGWLDLPAINYACLKSNITDLILTKFDILNGMDKVPVCNSYGYIPVCPNNFFNVRPQYIDVQGWKDAKDYKQLQSFISVVEDFTKIKVAYVSVGVDKDDFIRLDNKR